MSKASGGGQAWLAKELRISQPRVSKLINLPDWPFGRGPWKPADLPGIRTHVSARRSVNNATAGAYDETPATDDPSGMKALARSPERVARVKLMIERTALVKLERE